MSGRNAGVTDEGALCRATHFFKMRIVAAVARRRMDTQNPRSGERSYKSQITQLQKVIGPITIGAAVDTPQIPPVVLSIHDATLTTCHSSMKPGLPKFDFRTFRVTFAAPCRTIASIVSPAHPA